MFGKPVGDSRTRKDVIIWGSRGSERWLVLRFKLLIESRECGLFENRAGGLNLVAGIRSEWQNANRKMETL